MLNLYARSVILGFVIVLFFRCMVALLSPVNHMRRGVNWGLVVHTATMFLLVTIYVTMTLYVLFSSFTDGRDFTGVDGVVPPGLIGYQLLDHPKAIDIVPTVMLILTNWLADGLLVSRILSSLLQVFEVGSCIVAL